MHTRCIRHETTDDNVAGVGHELTTWLSFRNCPQNQWQSPSRSGLRLGYKIRRRQTGNVTRTYRSSSPHPSAAMMELSEGSRSCILPSQVVRFYEPPVNCVPMLRKAGRSRTACLRRARVRSPASLATLQRRRRRPAPRRTLVSSRAAWTGRATVR
jgi:hypothetical protein